MMALTTETVLTVKIPDTMLELEIEDVYEDGEFQYQDRWLWLRRGMFDSTLLASCHSWESDEGDPNWTEQGILFADRVAELQ